MHSSEKIHKKVQKERIISVEQGEALPMHIFEEFNGQSAVNAKKAENEQKLKNESVEPEVQPEAEVKSLTAEEIQADIQQAYDKGFSDGQTVTSALMESEIGRMRESAKNLDTLILELREQFIMETDKLQAVAVQVAMTISQHILAREISVNSQVAVEQAKKVLSQLHGLRDVTIRVNPESYEAMKDANTQLLNMSSSLRKIDIIPDATVENGGCLLETPMGSIDVQLSTQLEHLRSAMEETVTVKELAGEF